jgi:hypothetical protein
MFTINDDLSIYVTRGDTAFFNVSAEEDGKPYTFKEGDIVRIKVTEKKACENVMFQKDFPVTAPTENVSILLTEEDTKIGDVISKPTDYWYEIELNPYSNPQTIIGYDEEGAKIFKLFPEGKDIGTDTKEEDIPVVDAELDATSQRPVENQAITRGMINLANGLREELTRVETRIDQRIDKIRLGIYEEDGCLYRYVGTEKEWFNPPMAEGTEYRTAKRYRGKTVYTKLIKFDTMESGNSQQSISEDNAASIFNVSGTYISEYAIAGGTVNFNNVEVGEEKTVYGLINTAYRSIALYNKTQHRVYNAFVTIEYTKQV